MRPDGSAFGALFDSTWKAELTTNFNQVLFPERRSTVSLRSHQPLIAAGGRARFGGVNRENAITAEWALGFHQCRYSYYPDARVRQVADEFRKSRLPCDVIWMDIDYIDDFRVFTFDQARFPDPKATNDYLHEKGSHSVWMTDPGVKIDPDYTVYDSGSRANLWVQTKEGKAF